MKLVIYYLFICISTQCYCEITGKVTTSAPGLLAVINEYWCWRGAHCHHGGKHVCGREKRTDERRMFKCECTVYKYNCSYQRVIFLHGLDGRNNKIQSYDELFAGYHCYKLNSCSASTEAVCGFDSRSSMLAVFEDRCTLLKANCKKFGQFQVVDMEVCDMQKSYQAKYENETFDFVHLTDKLLLRDETV